MTEFTDIETLYTYYVFKSFKHIVLLFSVFSINNRLFAVQVCFVVLTLVLQKSKLIP